MYYTTDSAKLEDTDPPPPPPPVLQARRTSSEKKGLTFVNVTPVTEPSPSSPAPDIARLLSSEHARRRASNAESSRNSAVASPTRVPSGGLRKLKKMATSTVLLVGKDSPMAQMRRDAEKQGLPPKLKMHLQTLAGVAAILALVVATGVGPHDDHGDDHGGDHGGADHGGEHGGHHNHIAIDLQVSLGIVAGLVAVTILFEKGKEYAEEHVPPLMQNVLEALFGELTVLGFIALFAYFLLELGIFAALSVEIYGEPTHLVHLFEQVHFQLFFVMAFFIGEALVLVRATLAAEDAWMSLEKKLANVKIGSADEMAMSKRAIVYGALVAARRLHGSAAARRLGPLHLRWWRHAECNDELVYVLLRERFIRPPHKAHAAAARRMTVEHHEYGGAAAKKAAAEAGSEDLPPDFDFSNYLRRRCFEIVASTLHVSTTTWLTVIAFVALSLETPAVLDVLHE